jgi:hypothetical protein
MARRQIDNLYYCRLCKKSVWRFSNKKRYKTFCAGAEKSVWLTLKSTVKVRFTLEKHIIDWLETYAKERGIGLNQLVNEILTKFIEQEKKREKEEYKNKGII